MHRASPGVAPSARPEAVSEPLCMANTAHPGEPLGVAPRERRRSQRIPPAPPPPGACYWLVIRSIPIQSVTAAVSTDTERAMISPQSVFWASEREGT